MWALILSTHASLTMIFTMKTLLILFYLSFIKAESLCPDHQNVTCKELELLILDKNGANLPFGLSCMGYKKYLAPALMDTESEGPTTVDFALKIHKVTNLAENKNVRYI